MSITKEYIKNLIATNSPVLFEIGAADGLDTQEFIKTFQQYEFKLYCFEPDKRNIEKFKTTINDDRVTLVESAIGDKNGEMIFNVSSTIYSSSLKKPTEKLFDTWPIISFDGSYNYNVNVITLDEFIESNKIDIVDFIWADVQGAEDLMIKGAKSSLNKIRYLYTEYSDIPYYQGEPTKNDIINMLGDQWILINDYGTDLLLKNKNL